MAEILGAIVNAVNCICNTSTCNCIDQHRNFNDDVDDLRRKLESLTSRKQDIESELQEAGDSGQTVKEEVNNWLKQVPDISGDVRALLEKAQRVKWYKRAWLDRLVCRKINMVKEMNEQGRFPEGLVIEKAPVHGKIIPTENLVGEISTKGKIWGYLMGDEVGMIGVCGIGGVGKSTIMKNVYNDLQRETRFHKKIWVTVSYPLNVFELQNKIARDMGERLPEEEEEMMRAAALMEIMRRVRYVLILDDVWEKFSLKDVGIPESTVQNGCKVIITSRSAETCSYLGCEIVKVQPLSQEESLTLFLNKVGHDVLKIFGLEKILKLIVKECAGLPLAIVVIAGSMKGVKDIKVWRNALTELQEYVKSVKGSDDEIFVRLRFSFDRLANTELKNCFLYCSLFREDYEFEREDLIEGWIDEGLIDGFRCREAAYDRGHALLDMIENNCLLEKCVHFNRVKMHDVVRDMAIKSIGPEVGYMVKTGMKLTEVPNEHEWAIDLNKVSLMANEISKIPVGLTPKCPTLSTLILSNNPLTEIPESFFEDMGALKVLDLSRTGIEALPDSISNLENLTALRLQSCTRLQHLPSLEKLGALKKLDVRWTGINVVPQGVEMLECLEYLDLCRCPLKEIPESFFEGMSGLKVLDLSSTDIESLPDSICNLEHLSALMLRQCKRLKCLPSLEKLGALKKLDLSGAGINVVPQGVEMLECLEYLDLCYCPLKEIPTGILSKLSNLQYLVTGHSMGHSSVRINVEELARLRKLEILECHFDDMQDFNYFLSEFNFQSLATYKLKVGPVGFIKKDASNPEHKFILKFVGCDIGKECMVLPDRLQHLSIHYCKNMRSSLNKTALIENATELSLCIINGCKEIETVVELDSSSSSLCRPVLDKLEWLGLWDLPRLCVLVRVEEGSTPPGVFSNLKYLQVESCSRMRTLLSLELLQALQNLEMIEVKNCKQMEEIIASSDSDSSSDKFTFTVPKLSYLYLSNLPQLKSICSAKGVMVCDSIENIHIKECPELKRIPVRLPLLENGQPSPPPQLRKIYIHKESKEWWESVEWDHPNAKNLLQPFVDYENWLLR